MEELCCLAVAGELCADEKVILDLHLAECQECRGFLTEMEHISLFDLSLAAAVRMENQSPDNLELSQENRLFEQVVERVQQNGAQRGEWPRAVPACPIPFSRRVSNFFQKAYPVAGWCFAAAILCGWGIAAERARHIPASVLPVTTVASGNDDRVLELWKARAVAAESRTDEDTRRIAKEEARAAASTAALEHTTEEYQKLSKAQGELEAKLSASDEKLRQQAADLTTARADIEEERGAKDSLQAQLHDVNQRLDTQKAEVAHLQEVSSNASVRLPVIERSFREGDAREIFGARDLHIVDVYDVDHAGKASRTYGRVYYVNHHLLLFYAFDLANTGKSKKPVAFQAWGFRQPNSTSVESLGLFCMDDAKQDRWVLRVSDPQILARIDTLFVTAEPLGGSESPKGRQLLLASLAGPANHP